MIDAKNRLGVINIHDLARKEVCGIFETKNFTEEQKRKIYKDEREMSKYSQMILNLSTLAVIS